MQVKGGRYAVPIGIFSPEWLLAFGMCFIFNLHFLEEKKEDTRKLNLIKALSLFSHYHMNSMNLSRR